MQIKTIVDVDCTHYKVPSMLINTVSCDMKCCASEVEQFDFGTGEMVSATNKCHCNAEAFLGLPTVDVDIDDVINRYLKDERTSAIVFSGLEPFEQIDDIIDFVRILRTAYKRDDDVVIYTGYYPIEGKETRGGMVELEQYPNIVVKWGRYLPDHDSVYDDVLGVKLSSDNQFGERIS